HCAAALALGALCCRLCSLRSSSRSLRSSACSRRSRSSTSSGPACATGCAALEAALCACAAGTSASRAAAAATAAGEAGDAGEARNGNDMCFVILYCEVRETWPREAQPVTAQPRRVRVTSQSSRSDGAVMPLSGHQFVTRAGRGLQKLGARRIVLDLLPQPVDELLEQLSVAGAAVTPDMHQQ